MDKINWEGKYWMLAMLVQAAYMSANYGDNPIEILKMCKKQIDGVLTSPYIAEEVQDETC